MILEAFTLVHVLISLVGIGSGLAVLFGFLTAKRSEGTISVFLWTTVATSATGFLFPFHGFLPSYAVGLVSLLVLGIAFWARGKQARTFIITSIFALYMNVFVLVVQLFRKVPALQAMAPTQTEPPFQIAQLVVLSLFLLAGIVATVKSKRELRTA